MRKITLICLSLVLSIILLAFISCDETEKAKDNIESFENELALIEKTHDFDNGVETYKVKFSDGTFKKIEIENKIDVSIIDAELDDAGNLILTMSDNTIRNLGRASGQNGEKGADGDKGAKGQKGAIGNDGNSIDEIKINDLDLEISYTDGTKETLKNAYEKDSWTKVYESFKRKYPDYDATEEEFVVDIVANLLFTTEYTVKFEVMGSDVNIPEQKVLWGEKVTPVTAPIISKYEFLGWYVNDDRWSFVGCVVTEDITLVAKYRRLSCEEITGGAHSLETVETEATCVNAGTKISTCSLCGHKVDDVLYKSMHPALGHKWVEDGEVGDGWVTTNFRKTRACLREGCDKTESQKCLELTMFATITATSEAGGYPELEQWSGLLKDGDWENNGACPRAGAPLVIELAYKNVPYVDADIIAFSASGAGDDGEYSQYRVLVTYKDQEDEILVSSGKITSTNNTKDSAIVVDLGENGNGIVKIRIVIDNPTSLDCFYEILVGRYESEE